MKKVTLLLLLLLTTVGFAVAQRNISGTVTDVKGDALVGASVVVKGTTAGAQTDIEGKFAISVAKEAVTLVVSYIGFDAKEVAIGASNIINISLSENANVLADFVVTGTGNATDKRRLAIDVQTLSSKGLPPAPTASIDQALVGKIAGAQISSVNGTPGAKASIVLRGINTINRGTSPMIMMDGVEVGATDLNALDLTVIDRVEVVQGAAGASLYGAQGANGVIQLFTKKGKSGQLNIDFSTSVTTNQYLNVGGLKKADLHGFATDASNNVIGASSKKPLALDPDLLVYDDNVDFNAIGATTQINKPYGQNLKYIDHFKVFLQDALSTRNSLTVSGGSDRFDFAVSGSHFTQGSNFVGNGNYARSNLTANLGVNLAKNLVFRSTTQMGYTKSTINDGGGNATIYALFNTRPFVDYSLKQPDGNYPAFQGGAQGVNGTNPFYINQYSSSLEKTTDLIQSFSLTYTPIKYLELSAKYGLNNQNKDFLYIYQNQTGNTNQEETGYFWSSLGDNTGEIQKDKRKETFQNALTTATLRFDLKNDFGINFPLKSTTLVGYDYRKKDYNRFRTVGFDLPTYEPFTIRQAATQRVQNDLTEPFLTFGSLVNQRFDYGELFGIAGGFRSDYSSAFGAGSKAFTFPNGNAYVRLSEFNFWKNGALGKLFPEFKLRAAFGSAGIQPKPFDRYVTLDTKTIGTGTSFYFGPNQSNPNLEVEISEEREFGADIALVAGKGSWFNSIILSPTYWKRETKNAIWDVDAAPSGGIGSIKDNSFSLGSSGFQVQLKTQIAQTRDFSWNFDVNFGKQSSEITAIKGAPVVLTSAAGSTNYVLSPGLKIGQLFGFIGLKSLDQKDDKGNFLLPQDKVGSYEVASNGWVVNKATKFPYFSADQYSFGDPNPKFLMSFINGLTYKNMVTLNFQFDWVNGSHIYNQTKEWMYRDGIHSDYQQPITINGETGAWSAFYRGVYAERSRNGTKNYFYEDASFLRLRNLEVIFELKRILDLKFAKRLQLSLSGRNLWTLTKYTGMDPEINSSNVFSNDGDGNSAWDRGTDHNSMPNLRSFQVGLNIGF